MSSKRVGLVADGITWDNSAILREHLDLRARFPNVRLMWSSEWSVFEPDWWVTATGVTFPGYQGALDWCLQNGFDSLHCYAKIVSKTRPVEGTTKHNP